MKILERIAVALERQYALKEREFERDAELAALQRQQLETIIQTNQQHLAQNGERWQAELNEQAVRLAATKASLESSRLYVQQLQAHMAGCEVCRKWLEVSDHHGQHVQ